MFGGVFDNRNNQQMLTAGLQDMLMGLNRRPMTAVTRLSNRREAQKWREQQAEISQQRWEIQNARAEQQAQRQQAEWEQKQQQFQQQQGMCASLPEGPVRDACMANPAAYSKEQIESSFEPSGVGGGQSMFGKSMEGRAHDIVRQLNIKQSRGEPLTAEENYLLQQAESVLRKPDHKFNPMTQSWDPVPSSWQPPRLETAPNGMPRVAEKGEPEPKPMNVPSLKERLAQGFRQHSLSDDQKFYGPEDATQDGMMPEHLQEEIDMQKSSYSRNPQMPQVPMPQTQPAPGMTPEPPQAGGYAGAVPNTPKGVENLRSSQEQLTIGLTAVDEFMNYLDSGEANVGAVNTMVSKGAATAWQVADVADEFGVPGAGKIKEAADDVVERTSTATSKMYRTRITQNFKKMFTDDDRLTDKDWERLEAATAGVEGAVTVEEQKRKMKELKGLVVELYNLRYDANREYLPGARRIPTEQRQSPQRTTEETVDALIDELWGD